MKTQTREVKLKNNSQQRREANKAELRALILKAAGREFEEHGYEHFSLRRVAERIGYSPTTIYIYFQNKDALLLATVKGGFAAFDQTIATAAEQDATPLERLRNFGRAYIKFGLEHPAIYRLMFMQRADMYVLPHLIGTTSEPPEIDLEMDMQHRVMAQALLVSAVEDGLAKGEIREGDAVILADALWTSVHGLVSLATSPLMSPEHAHELSETLLDVLIDGLKRPNS